MRVIVVGEIVRMGSTRQSTVRYATAHAYTCFFYGIFNGTEWIVSFNNLFYNNCFFLFMTEWE